MLKAIHELLTAILDLWPLYAAISVVFVALTLYFRSRKQILFEAWVSMVENKTTDLGKSVADLLLFKIGQVRHTHERSDRAIGSWNIYRDVPTFRQGLDEDVKLLASVELGKYASVISSFLMILFRLVPMVLRPARLRGSIHQYGEQLHLLASLEFYGQGRRKRTNYVWEVVQAGASPERLPDAVEELAYKIFIDLVQEDVFKSWRAFRAYTEGLSRYISYVDLKADSDYQSAEQWYKNGLEEEPQSAALHYNLGVLRYYQFTTSSNKEAIANFTEALKSSHARLRAYAHSGLANALLQQYVRFNVRQANALQEAVYHAKRACDIEPNLDSANKALAFAYHQLSEKSDSDGDRAKVHRDLAIKFYRRAFELNPRNYIAHNNLGNLYLEWATRRERRGSAESKRLLSKAAKEIEACLTINPQYHHAQDNLANVFRELGDFDRAIESYWNALRANPNYPEAMNDLATLYLERDFKGRNLMEAKNYHEQALAMLQKDSDEQQVKKLTDAFETAWRKSEFASTPKAPDIVDHLINHG